MSGSFSFWPALLSSLVMFLSLIVEVNCKFSLGSKLQDETATVGSLCSLLESGQLPDNSHQEKSQ
ncbi:hypothetical protein GBAR_LOCUS13742, partial [Geodia barretti]